MLNKSAADSQNVSRTNSGRLVSASAMHNGTGQWLKASAPYEVPERAMPTVQWMTEEVQKVLPDASIEVVDLTGSRDHFHVRVVCSSFEGMRPLQRQKIILNHFKPYIPHEVHAIDIRCMTPEQAENTGDTVFHPHGGGTGVHIKSLRKHGHIE